ncbi:MAG: caspase family protein [Acidobacteriota bacterium]|nr:caspase family protein [Acidobacteriota bacterium]
MKLILQQGSPDNYDMALSPDGKVLVSLGWDSTINLWETHSGRLTRALSGHSGHITSLAFSPNGKILASSSWDNTIKLWNVGSGKLLRTLNARSVMDTLVGRSDDIGHIVFSPDGRMLASDINFEHNKIRLWNTGNGKIIRTLSGQSSDFESFVFSPDGRTLVSGNSDGLIKFWDVNNGQLIRTLSGHSVSTPPSGYRTVSSIIFSLDGKIMVSGSSDRTIKLWDASNGQLIRTLSSGHSKEILAVAFNPNGEVLASTSADRKITLWNIKNGQILNTFQGGANIIAFNPNGKALISSNGNIWSVETGSLIATCITIKDSWVTYTPDNYYVCSEDAAKYIKWKQGDKTLDHSAFSAKFNKPEIVAARLRSLGAEPTTIAATPQSNNTNPTAADTETPKPPPPTLKDTVLPKILVTSPPLTRGQGVKPAADRILKQSGSSLTVTGQATDESGVREVTVRGVAARLDERGNFSAEVPLQVGDNPITVTATDNSGNRATESFTVRRESEPPPVTGRYFALVIGNNRYPNLPPEQQLKTAINDAREVAKLLGAEYGFEIKLLPDAGREKILDALSEYRARLNSDDKLLIYYAGHGHFDKETGKAYWLPTDARPSSPANWIIADDVTATIKAIPARHILIVSDSCYSGTLTRATDFRLSTPAERERYLEKMRGGTSRILMASGGNEPVADGGGGNHSVFARALLDGLRGMSERVFTADELFHQFIKERVAGKSDQTPEYNPLRNSGHEAGDFIFVRQR